MTPYPPLFSLRALGYEEPAEEPQRYPLHSGPFAVAEEPPTPAEVRAAERFPQPVGPTAAEVRTARRRALWVVAAGLLLWVGLKAWGWLG